MIAKTIATVSHWDIVSGLTAYQIGVSILDKGDTSIQNTVRLHSQNPGMKICLKTYVWRVRQLSSFVHNNFLIEPGRRFHLLQ